MTAAQYGNIPQCPSDQCGTLTGGNAALEPEVADTISVGFTLTPTALPDFSMSVDWYEIEMEDIVGIIPLNVSFDGCALSTNPAFCSNIVRRPFGTLFGDTIAGGGYVVGRVQTLLPRPSRAWISRVRTGSIWATSARSSRP